MSHFPVPPPPPTDPSTVRALHETFVRDRDPYAEHGHRPPKKDRPSLLKRIVRAIRGGGD